MGASRIQGITVEIGGDTTKLIAALKGVNGEIRTTQSQLRDVERLLKLESREAQTETLTIKARPLASGYVKAKTGNKTSAETYANWYKSVYLPEPKAVDAETEGQG